MSGLEPWRYGALVIDPHARAVSYHDEPIELTRREFDMLATLTAHPGWVYSSEMLANAEPTFYGSPSSVNVHIARLRKKLARAGCAGLVETVRGVGYRLNPNFSRGVAIDLDPFVGRNRELAELDAALKRVMEADEGRFVLISGEAGMGKSRLAEEFGHAAAQLGVEVFWGRSAESGAPPYWSWSEVLREILVSCDDRVDSALAAEIMALAGMLPGLVLSIDDREVPVRYRPPQAATFALYDGVLRALADASRRRAIAIVFDDLQWADAETLALLTFWVRHTKRSRVLIIGLCREEGGSSRDLDRTLGECAGRRQTACMRLGGLSVADVDQLARASGAQDVDARAAAAIHSRTGGNALFVCELLQMMATGCGLGEGTSTRLADLMPTPNLRNVVRSRVARLAPEAVALLNAAAVFGREFSLAALERLCDLGGVDVLDAIGEAIDAGILTACDEPERLHFRHGLVQQVIYLEIPAATRIRLHGRVGDVLAEGGDPSSSELTAIAAHYREAAPGGYAEKALEYAVAAGRSAMTHLGFETAVQQFAYARRLIASESAIAWPTELSARVEEGWGDALAGTARLAEAIDAYRAAASHRSRAARVGHARLRGKLGRLLTETRDWAGAHDAFDQSADELAQVPEVGRGAEWRHVRVASEVARMWLLYFELDGSGMERWVAEVGDEVERLADPAELADYLGAILSWRILGDRYWPSEDTVALARRALVVAASLESPSRLASALTLLGYVLLWNGQLAEARLRLDEGLLEGERVCAYATVMTALAALSCLDRIEDDVAAALISATRCESRAAELGGWSEFGAMGTATIAWIALRDGDADGVREHAARAFAGWSLAPMYPFKWAAVWPLLAVAVTAGDGDAAVANARLLLEPGAQPPRGELGAVVAGALAAADGGDGRAALASLRRAVELGREFGYT